MIKQAIILCAGLGTRLRPYTDTMPKPMIPVLGKPLLEWHIEQFKKYGVEEFFLNLHYLPDTIRDYFSDGSKWSVRINYHFEPQLLGTAGGMKTFESQVDGDFFLTYGDIFSLIDYGKMEESYVRKERPIGMQRVARVDHYDDADVAEMDNTGKFTAVHPKPHVQRYESAHRMRGSFIFNKRIFSYIPSDSPFEIGSQLLPTVIAAGERFYGFESDDYSKGIDTVEKWHEVEEYLKKL